MRSLSSRSVRNVATLAIAGLMLAASFLSPAGAHVAGHAHNYQQHLKPLIKKDFFPRPAANARFERQRPGAHLRNHWASRTNAVQFSNLSDAPQVLETINFNVPAGQSWYGIVTFTAESACWNATGWCVINVLVDGGAITAHPNVGLDFAFDSSDSNTETGSSWKGLSMRRATDPLPPGPHTVEIIGYVTGAPLLFRIDDALTTVDLYRA